MYCEQLGLHYENCEDNSIRFEDGVRYTVAESIDIARRATHEDITIIHVFKREFDGELIPNEKLVSIGYPKGKAKK